MQCPECGKTGRVNISGKQYCSSCGHAFDQASVAMTDLRNGTATTPPSPTQPPLQPAPIATVSAPPRPANQFHASTNVLDLRQGGAKPAATKIANITAPVATPPPPPAPTPEPTQPSAPAAPRFNTAMPTAPPTAATATPNITTSSSRNQIRQANASATIKSKAIQKFGRDAQSAPEPPPVQAPRVPLKAEEPIPIKQAIADAASVPTAQPASSPITASSQPRAAIPVVTAPMTKAQEPVAAPTAPSKPVSTPTSLRHTSAVMPGSVTTAVEANQNLVTPAMLASNDKETSRKAAFALALANAPKRNTVASVAAGVVAIAIMSGYIWLSNAPKLALRTAAAKAGFEASLPTYVPNGYNLDRPIESSPGRVTLAFSSPGRSNVTLTQQKTDWDSKSLLDNYVQGQSNQYLAVDQQGLTIYIYNGDSASWVNQGIWYSIQGHNQLSREQLLKIAYGL